MTPSFCSFSFFFLISCLITPKPSSATDTITASQFLKEPSSLISSNGVFKLGFFTPSGSTNRYLAIGYNKASQDIIWVANRDKPLTASPGSATLKIAPDGTLQLVDGQNKTLWSSNMLSATESNSSSSPSTARLMDSGNLVLDGSNSWQSFDHLQNSFLPSMKVSFSSTANSTELTFLHSWKSSSDPSEGRFLVGFDSISVPQIVIWEYGSNQPLWRSGPWSGTMFGGIQAGDGSDGGFNLQYDRRTSLTFTYSNGSALSNYRLTDQGTLEQQLWDDGKNNWKVAWQAPQTKCDAYGRCGVFASCNTQRSPICQCLRGFDPKNMTEWNSGNWTNGCIRKTKLQNQCTASGGAGGGSGGGGSGGGVGEDGFWTMNTVKVPDKADWLLGLNADECKSTCLNNCSCLAYVYDTAAGCLSWSKDLIDTVELTDGGLYLNIRLASSDLPQSTNSKSKMIGVIAGILGTVIFASFLLFLWRWMGRKPDERNTTQTFVLEGRNDVELEELPLFKLEKLVTATNDFDTRNKLGQGGFGPVYKGTLEDGREIAVKRLSRASGQGLHEFMNEVGLISKLQHRNLVRLLGCCVEAEEKMLVYEYMPNNSLDALLFDPQKRELLDWKKRFSIIQGICRGILYLHRDSRLRIIHRDLKASNILLDENHNPKISDFGMARIFGGNQDQENTKRVVGTYGYMAPEYAMEGKFSEKSDVFSFGVLLLEIVSGRKNTSFSLDDHSLSLLAHAWNLWNEQDVVSLIDPMIANTCFLGEITKCIRVGLLCVQEFSKDRPSISKVIYFLGSEIADIPIPKPPGFVLRRMQMTSTSGEGSSSQQAQQQSSSCSVYGDDASITVLVGR